MTTYSITHNLLNRCSWYDHINEIGNGEVICQSWVGFLFPYLVFGISLIFIISYVINKNFNSEKQC